MGKTLGPVTVVAASGIALLLAGCSGDDEQAAPAPVVTIAGFSSVGGELITKSENAAKAAGGILVKTHTSGNFAFMPRDSMLGCRTADAGWTCASFKNGKLGAIKREGEDEIVTVTGIVYDNLPRFRKVWRTEAIVDQAIEKAYPGKSPSGFTVSPDEQVEFRSEASIKGHEIIRLCASSDFVISASGPNKYTAGNSTGRDIRCTINTNPDGSISTIIARTTSRSGKVVLSETRFSYGDPKRLPKNIADEIPPGKLGSFARVQEAIDSVAPKEFGSYYDGLAPWGQEAVRKSDKYMNKNGGVFQNITSSEPVDLLTTNWSRACNTEEQFCITFMDGIATVYRVWGGASPSMYATSEYLARGEDNGKGNIDASRLTVESALKKVYPENVPVYFALNKSAEEGSLTFSPGPVVTRCLAATVDVTGRSSSRIETRTKNGECAIDLLPSGAIKSINMAYDPPGSSSTVSVVAQYEYGTQDIVLPSFDNSADANFEKVELDIVDQMQSIVGQIEGEGGNAS